MIVRMIRAVSLTTLVAAFFAATALAATAPGVKGEVAETSSQVTVTITNTTGTVYKGYFIAATDSPKLTSTTDKSCKMGKSKPYKSGGKTHTDTYADCTGTLKAHGKVVVKLGSSGTGKIVIWVKTKTGLQLKVSQ
jgi:hypothetical protein